MPTVKLLTQTIQPWPYSTSGTVKVQAVLSKGGIDGDGNPQVAGAVTEVVGTVSAGTVAGTYKLTIPDMVLVPTDNWRRPRNAKYDFRFVVGTQKHAWSQFQNCDVPAAFPNFPDPTQGTWDQLALFNDGHIIYANPAETFTKQEIYQLIAAVNFPLTSSQGFVFAGPAVGAGATAMRALVAGDIPTLTSAKISDFATAAAAQITNATVLAAIGYTPSAVGHTHVAANVTDFATAAAAVADSRITANVTAAFVNALYGYTPANPAALNASNLTAGTVPDARFPATLPALNASLLTALNAAALASGTVPTARLGSGTANSTTVLAGDQTYKTVATSLGFTPENAANRNASGGYAGLTAGKLALAQLQEVMAAGDLSNVDTTGLATGQSLAYNGANFVPKGGAPATTGDTVIRTAPEFYDINVAANLPTAVANYFTNNQILPMRIGIGIRGLYNVPYTDGGGTVGAQGNIFQFASYVETKNTRPTVALFAMAKANPSGLAGTDPAIGWGGNLVAYTDVSDASYAAVIGVELNFGVVNSGVNQAATGLYLGAIGVAGTPAGANRSYIQMAVSTAVANARAVNGIAFVNTGGFSPVTNVLLYAPAMAGMAGVGDFTNSTFTAHALDFASTTANSILRLPGYGGATGEAPGVSAQDHANTTALRFLFHSWDGVNNTLNIGDYNNVAGVGVDEIRFHIKSTISTTDHANRAHLNADGFGAVHLNGWNGAATAPSLTTGAFTGGGTANPSITSASIAGRDPGHRLTFTTTAAPVIDAKICAVTFAQPWPVGVVPVIVAKAEQANGLAGIANIAVKNATKDGYELWAGSSALSATATYNVDIIVIGY